MDSQQQQPAERIKQANNILVTVSSNPSVDQLAALLGLTIGLNKMNKHATAVFSGDIPSTLEFLQPEKTIEKNTDSLRDFIIALDKSKADKLRYKVEDRVVKIFITPYRTSISDKDLEFSQGDFNVDVVIALGVHSQAELDHAITTHGRILHDATIITLNTQPGGELGSINWVDSGASSLSEIAVRLINVIDKSLIDGQIATAFLTGIVAETDRFSNAKTSPQTMSISAQLMSSGANQQLVATELAEPVTPVSPAVAPIAVQAPGEALAVPEPVKKSNDGTLEIAHDQTKRPEEESAASLPEETKPTETPLPASEDIEKKITVPEPITPPQISIDEHGSLVPSIDAEEAADEALLPPPRSKVPEISHHSEAPKMILEPPAAGEEMLAGGGSYETEDISGLPGMPVQEEPKLNSSDPAHGSSLPLGDSLYETNAPGTSFLGDQPLESAQSKKSTSDSGYDKTLSEIEKDVHAHQDETQSAKPDAPAIPIITPTTPTPSDSTLTPPVVPAFTSGAMLPPVQDSFASASVPIEEDVASIPNMPVSTPSAAPSVDGARDAVAAAMSADADQPLGAIQALNANPGLSVGHNDVVPEPAIQLPPSPVQPWTPTVNAAGDIVPQAVTDPSAPPSVPPPMMPTPQL